MFFFKNNRIKNDWFQNDHYLFSKSPKRNKKRSFNDSSQKRLTTLVKTSKSESVTLDSIRLYPSLPSEDKADTEPPTGCAGGNPQFQIKMQKTEQTELQSPAREKTLHKELQKVKTKIENWSFVQT